MESFRPPASGLAMEIDIGLPQASSAATAKEVGARDLPADLHKPEGPSTQYP